MQQSLHRRACTGLVLVMVTGLSSGCERGGGGPAALIRSAAGDARPVEPRLSAFPDHAACDGAGVVCRSLEPGVVDELMAAASALRARDGLSEADRLGHGGTLDLVTSLATGNGAGASVEFYRRAAEASEPPEGRGAAPDWWSDLAAAYLVRSRTNGTPADVLWAVEASERALAEDSTHAPAAFNLALALEHLGLYRSGARAWRRHQRMETARGWAAEAGERARRLDAALATERELAPGTESMDAGRTRLLAMDSLLPGWGEQVLAGNEAGATELLRRAAGIGARLASAGGDGSVAAAVAEAEAAGQGSARRRLASAWVAWGGARTRYAAGAYGAAAALFDEAAQALPAGADALASWLAFYRGVSLIYTGDPERAAERLRALVARTDARTYPALAGRALWGIGSIELRAGRFEEAQARFRAARTLFERASEIENAGATRYLGAEAGIALGQSWSAADSVIAALGALNQTGGESVWLHNLLYSAADHVRSLGLPRAALALQTEGVEVAERMALPIYHAEALLARARLQLRMGRVDPATRDLRQSDSLLALIDDPGGRRWIANDRAHTAALLALAAPQQAAAEPPPTAEREPAALADVLGGVADFFADVGSTPRQAGALLDQARALRRAGDGASERAVLGEVLRIGEAQVSATATFQLRASLAAVVRQALARAVDHDLEAGEPARAFALLSRWSAMRMGRPGERVPEALDSAGASVGVAYLLTDSAMAIWVNRGGRLEGRRVPADRDRVLALLDALDGAAGMTAAAAEIEPALTSLHELLLAPIFAGRDGVPPRLRIYAEGPLARVPFAALRNPRTGRHLVEGTVVEYASTAAAAMAAPSAGSGGSGPDRALVVAADAFTPGAQRLPPLPWARAEAAAVATAYPRARLLSGDSATPTAVTTAAADATLFHFAGHAVLDADRPWQSRLILVGDSLVAGALAASDLGRALAGLELVVLAACRSASPHQALSDGFTGFGDALLSAGVGAAIGSIWDVPDRDSSTLMARFHQEYAAGSPPADALRTAQLAALHSDRASESHPGTWAGFRALVH